MVGQFIKKNPPTFNVVKVEEDSHGFLDKIEKNFRVMQAMNVEVVNLTAYQLNDMAYQWYGKWYRVREDFDKSNLWENLSYTFLDNFFPLEIREAKAEKFFNLS